MRDLDLFKWLNIAITSGVICAGNCAMSTTGCAYAQITPDSTLPNNSNIQKIDNTIKIEGGTTAGSNLFHSFSEFSLTTGSTADFDNSLNIQNIISRVTGKSLSNIDGLIRANGTANLFLINPNGIIFGQNAQLDIGGSFVASTASSLKFPNGFEFSAKNPQSAPLLSINVPIGLQYGTNPGVIQVKGDGQGHRTTDELINTTFGLRVKSNQTLALVGGDVSLEGATLKTAGGRIELGSVAGEGLVSLTFDNKSFFLGYDAVPNFGNIQLSQQTTVDASGAGGGNIQVQGKQITLTNGSQIATNTLGAEQGGSLVVHATDVLQVIGTSNDGQYRSNLSVQTQGTGNAGELRIDTQKLLIQDGALVDANTFGAGNSGNLFVTAESVQVIGNSKDGEYSSNLSAEAYDTGNAGELRIDTHELLIQDGALVDANTLGAGNGGNLFVTANSVEVIGRDGQYGSNLSVQTQGTGNAGELRIDTQKLLIQDGAFVDASTFGAGKGGNLFVTANSVQVIGSSNDGLYPSNLTVQANNTGNAGELRIDTQKLLIQDGAQVSAGTRGGGKGGNLFVTADSVQVIGSSNNGQYPSNLSVQAKSIGTAGSLFVEANSVGLDNNAKITADTTGGGGDIFLRTPLLTLRNHSSITTNATGENIPGGNITINAPDGFIVAVPQENSDINANSIDFRGGRVAINAQSIFGMQYRSNVQTPQSDITATGANPQFNGTVQINTPDIDPSSGLVELPVDFVDRSGLIAQGCPANKGNSFTITGRGGLPPLPTQALRTNQTATVDWVTLNPREQRSTSVGKNLHFRSLRRKSPDLEVPQISPTIVEATGWVINKSGTVELTTFTPVATHTNTFTPAIALGGACPSQATTIQK